MLHLYNLIYNPIIYNDVECLTLWGSFHDQLGGGGGGWKAGIKLDEGYVGTLCSMLEPCL